MISLVRRFNKQRKLKKRVRLRLKRRRVKLIPMRRPLIRVKLNKIQIT